MKPTFSKSKDINIEILNKLNDKDLIAICLVDKYLNSLCNDQIFWQRRVISRYGNYLDIDILKKYKGDLKWSDYYIELHKILRDAHPGYQAAKAFEKKRFDIVELIYRLKGVRLRPVEREDQITYFSYDPKVENVMRQGKYYSNFHGEIEAGEYLDGMKIGRWVITFPNGDSQISEYYMNGGLKSLEVYQNNRLIQREYYDETRKPRLLDLWIKQYY